MFEPYLARWNLLPDGEPISTRSGHLPPVLRGEEPAMLKLSHRKGERSAAVLMEWWDGEGAARVFAQEGANLLLERAMGTISLADMARSGRDDEASSILCAAGARLHAARSKPLPDLIALQYWFRDLEPAAARYGGILARCAEAARILLAEPREVGALHGDLHHANLLDFGARGWLAIDPTGLIGERGFDFANIFTNPDIADPTRPVATEPGRFARRLEVVVGATRLER